MGSGIRWICSKCKTWYSRKDEEPQLTDSEGRWICDGCRIHIGDPPPRVLTLKGEER